MPLTGQRATSFLKHCSMIVNSHEHISAHRRPKKPLHHVRPILWIAAALLLIVASGVVAAVLVVGFVLSAPARAVIGSPPPDLHAETVTIPSKSGATLRGWFVVGRRGGGAVVLMHGIHSNRLSMVRRARLLNATGFSVFLFDFQAHGESTGARITFGHLEAEDAGSAVAFVRARLPNERIGAIGTSLGGAAALLGPHPLPVNALVLESVYSDIALAITNRLRAVMGPSFGGIVAPGLEYLFELLLPPVLGVKVDLRPIDHIAEIGAPIFVASGTSDDRTTIAETTAMFARAKDPKFFWRVAGARHVDLEAFAPDEYRNRVLPFLVESLQQ
jgi:alpha/beta superfamily hydrolase